MGGNTSENTQYSIYYVNDDKIINQCEIEINEMFIYNVAIYIKINTDNDQKP